MYLINNLRNVWNVSKVYRYTFKALFCCSIITDEDLLNLKKKMDDSIFFLKQKLNGGTTVSGTMVVANLVGIKIFVTGGIGGVHYGVQESE